MGRKAMTAAAKALAACAVDLVGQPEILVEAKRELAERLAGRTYVSLIPREVKPPL